jgi:uncharacterized protein with HEPN domain
MVFPIRDYILCLYRETEFLLEATKELDFDRFNQSMLLKRACERSLEIISLATISISEQFKHKYSQIKWKELEAYNDKLMKVFFTDYELLWDTIQNEIPALKEAMEVILKYEPFDEF